MKNQLISSFSGWKKYVFVYALLLFASHLVIRMTGETIHQENRPETAKSLQIVEEDSSLSERKIDVNYQDIYTGKSPDPPVLLLLPGGLEGPDVFNELIDDLSSRYRLILPHLPAYENRNGDLPNYSFQTLSVYTYQLLEKLNVSNVHVVGYGLGGASAIYLANDYPQKVESLSLISSIGVQELELLGSYRLNHAVHGIQLGVVWILYNAVPHFGLLDLIGINMSYAKSHYESDQRPLRSYLSQYQKPMLVLHGLEDPLVPLAAAKEHHRIVPQSKLELLDGDHDIIETHSDSVSKVLTRFISDVKAGKARTAADAPPERVKEAQKPFSNIEFQKFKGISLLIIMLIIILATLVSEDLTCIGAGLLAARGLIGFWPATAACLIGIFVGDIGLYLIGRKLGRPVIRKAPFKWFISEKDLNKSAEWFKVRGPTIIIATRFLPGSRLPTYLSAGIIGAGFWMFTLYFLLAAAVWTPMLVGISKFLGNELMRYFSLYQDYAIWVFLAAVLLLVAIIKVIIPAFSYKGRRLLVSRYRRLTRWEYWSPFILYTPVFMYIVYLGIKHRSITLFTACNPALPNGGFIGESKTEILNQFDKQRYLPAYRKICSEADPQHMLREANQFMEKQDLSFPVVLKPDVGERGYRVEIISNYEDMKRYFKESEQDIMIQEYLSGEEFGVFYYHCPSDKKGKIFSITTTELLCVRGDGQSTVEELILYNNQTVNLAKYHLEQNQERLYNVPDEGEQVEVVELGTHARGAIFGEGEKLLSEELVNTMNNICQSADGFDFGRFDLKAPSVTAFSKGRGIKIIEVNGVTSESTNIYDEKYSFWDAQRILMRQWSLAFEIGRQNHDKGVEVTSTLALLKSVFSTLRKS